MAAFLVDNVLTSALVPILPAIADKFGLGMDEIGWILSTRSLTQLFHSLLIVGHVIRRFGARNVFIYGIVLEIGTCVLTGYCNSIITFILAQVLHGIGGSCFYTAGVTQIIECSPENMRGRMLGIFYSGIAWGTLFGTLLGGSLYNSHGQLVVFLSIAGLMGAVLITAFVFAPLRPSSALPVARVGLRNTCRLACHNKIACAMVMIATSNACVGNTLVLFPNYLSTYFSLDSASIGYFMMLGPGVYVIVSHIAGLLADRNSKIVLTRLGLTTVALAFLSIWLVYSSIIAFGALYTIAFAATSFVDVTQPGVIAATLDEMNLEGVYTMGAALGDISVSIGYATMVMFAAIEKKVRLRATLTITAGIVFFVVIGHLTILRERRPERRIRIPSNEEDSPTHAPAVSDSPTHPAVVSS